MMKKMIFGFLFMLVVTGCSGQPDEKQKQSQDSLLVTATAYNSIANQTTAVNASITAWGDTLKPGMKVIAVSRDLISKGLTHNTPVRIQGLEGVYLVKDKMHKRWTNKIDIYMGTNIEKALSWGRQEVVIYYKRK